MNSLLLLGGLVLLYYGAEWLVKGSVGIALKSGISQLVVGLTVVAFGTSAPELVVSVDAALHKSGDIAAGNVVGSNIFNIAVILGLSALLCPMRVKAQLLRFDLPVMLAATVLLSLFLYWGRIFRWEGILFLAAISAYTLWHINAAKKNKKQEMGQGIGNTNDGSYLYFTAFLIAGLITIVLGARFLVESSVQIARQFGISEAVIGLTIISAGTSLPELATSVVAAIRKESDIALGNIVGSNILNSLAIIGAAGTIQPFACEGISHLDIGFMLILSLALLPFMRSSSTLSRWEGGLLLAGYAAYLYFLWPK
ncbi:MAG: calcium:proton exchanger [Lentisphaerae bacterium GWF2_52_8]|nr:MAG: calcium:proton exchanger [Lentisphaerae bacterium GWF2_52_8]